MNWDNYFLELCNSIASKSPCISRKIGAVLVRDKSIISTGYNGPARGIPHCGYDRYDADKLLRDTQVPPRSDICPRKLLAFPSGEGMQWCTAQHAEENCISNASRNGVSTLGCTLYLNSVVPCKNCFSTLINSGIVEIVCTDAIQYDKYTNFIQSNSSIKVRTFNAI